MLYLFLYNIIKKIKRKNSSSSDIRCYNMFCSMVGQSQSVQLYLSACRRALRGVGARSRLAFLES